MKKELLIILLLLLFTIPAVKSLFIPGGFTAHDLTHHVIRQISMDKLLSEGQFPPRWSGELNNGFGYPVFLFNYPLPAMFGEIFHLSGFGYVDSVKAVLFSSMLISIFGMYLFLNSLLGNGQSSRASHTRLAAFLGAVFYLYAPIRFLNTYVSASVGSALALGILPLVSLSLVEVTKGKKWAVLLGGVSLACLVLAHNVTTLIFAPVLFVFSLVIGGRKAIKDIGLMFLLGLGLSAWFWFPALIEKQYIQFDGVFDGFYKDQFISLWQLIRSPWGYGLSHPQKPEPGDMSYQLGLIHIGVMIVLSIWYFVFGRKTKDKILIPFVLVIFFSSIFLMLKESGFLWDNLPFLSIIQFPLRFSSLAIFAASIAAALLVKYLPYKKILFAALLILVIYANRNHWHINEVFDPGEEYYLSQKPTTASFNEHLPKWGRDSKIKPQSPVEFLNGDGRIEIQTLKSNLILAEIESTSSARVKLNQFYFPGWEIKVDGKKADFTYLVDPDLIGVEGESYGLMVFDISSGKHSVLAEFKNTLVRNIADFISLISVILWSGLLCKLLTPHLLKRKKSS